MSFPVLTGVHFNGGTITWAPIDPFANSSVVGITITQSYSWSYPTIICANNVPISTSGRSGQNDNLNCVVDCSTDGDYSLNPIDILTDCTSSSSSLGMMTSSRSRNVTLRAGAHFSIAYQGSAWRSLGSPATGGLDWSILATIDLRVRPDGFINTPPVATVVSPQYAIVNQTTNIKIPVSDVNVGDDLRCRWSIYQAGNRRRRDSLLQDDGFDPMLPSTLDFTEDIKHLPVLMREKRGKNNCNEECEKTCWKDCSCSCDSCKNTDCAKQKCEAKYYCTGASTTRTSKSSKTTTPSPPTTSETMGTKKSTSSFPNRQAIDECGGICHPSSVPTGTTLDNCTVSFTGLVAGAWYAVAIQVSICISQYNDFKSDTAHQTC